MKLVSDPYELSVGTFLQDTVVTIEYDLITGLKTVHFYNPVVKYFNFYIREEHFFIVLHEFNTILETLKNIGKRITINDGTS